MSSLNKLRNTAKEVLAAAVVDLFPAAQLIQGDVEEIGFFYDFFFPKTQISIFSKKELEYIEDRMRFLIHQNISIKKLEMMRENAALFIAHLGQTIRAEAIEQEPKNIVPLIEMGDFRDLCFGEVLEDTKDLKAFQLLEYEILSEECVRISGTIFPEQKELKNFLKLYKEAKKNDYRVLGPKLNYFERVNEEMVLLPNGEAFLNESISFWRKELNELKFSFIAYKEEECKEELQEELLKRKKLKKVAAFQGMKGDFSTILYESEKDREEALISSLHFMRKAFKIFGFETRAVCLQAKPSPLSLILEKEKFPFEIVKSKGCPIVEFRVRDSLGREKPLSFLRIEEEKKLLRSSLFWSLENWIALYIEKGVNRA